MKSTPPTLDDQASFYDERWDRESRRPLSGIRLARAAAILEQISRLRIENPQILDFGCGTGNFSGVLSHVGKVVGVELSQHAVEIAKTRMPHVDFRTGDVFEVGLDEASFDLVILQEVIEHVEDQTSLIARCRSLVKPAGYLIVTTPNKSITFKSGRFEKAKQQGRLQPIENLLSVSEVRSLVAQYFDVRECITICPVGHRGIYRVLNSERLGRIGLWRAFRSCFPIGLHTVVVAQRT